MMFKKDKQPGSDGLRPWLKAFPSDTCDPPKKGAEVVTVKRSHRYAMAFFSSVIAFGYGFFVCFFIAESLHWF